MHISTKPLIKLSKKDRDKYFEGLGVSLNKIKYIRKLPPGKRILEAARLALSIDPDPNSDFIEWLAGYSWRGALYHYYRNLETLLEEAGSGGNPHRRPNAMNTDDNHLDLSKFIPEAVGGSKVWIDSNTADMYVWQKVGIRVRSVKLRRIVSKNLFLIGIALYAGEGSKTPATTRKVELVNTSPVIIRLFVDFLENLGIPKSSLKARVHVHSAEEIEGGTNFWLKELGIEKEQFIKPLFKGPGKSLYRKMNPDKMPSIDIHYNNSMMRYLMIDWCSKLDKLV